MKSATEYLRRSYVRQNGRIFPWGCIRLYGNGVHDNGDEYGGLECWSKKLVPYGDGRHYAETNILLPNSLLIYNAETRKEAATIPFRNIFVAEVHMVRVMPGGFLNSVGKVGMQFSRNRYRFPTKSLKKAFRGERPDELDNSDFVKVSPDIVEQTLVQVTVQGGSTNVYRVFTKTGQAVKSQAKKWLAFAVWDPARDPTKQWRV